MSAHIDLPEAMYNPKALIQLLKEREKYQIKMQALRLVAGCCRGSRSTGSHGNGSKRGRSLPQARAGVRPGLTVLPSSSLLRCS
jgi:hypothetical protein